MAENEQFAKSLQVVKQEVEKLQESTQNAVSGLGEMKTMILVEVSTLGDTMQKLYDRFLTVHKAVVHVHGLQQQSKEFVQTLKNIHDTITHV